MKRILLLALLSAPMVAGEYSRAMENSAQVQAARQRDKLRAEKEAQQDRELQQAIEASKETHKQETARSSSPKPSAPVVKTEDADLKKAIEASKNHPQPKTSLLKRRWFKWATFAGITAIGAALVWYFRDTVNSKMPIAKEYAYTGYSRLTSLYKGQ